MHDRPVISAGPRVRRFGKRQAEQGYLGHRAIFLPGKAAVGRPIEHASFPDDPARFWIGKSHMEEIGQLRTGARTGQRAIYPMSSAVRGLKERSGIAHRPAGRQVREKDIKERDVALGLLDRPGDAPIVGYQNRPDCSHRHPVLFGNEMNRVERGVRSTGLFRPARPTVACMKDRAIPSDNPPPFRRGKGHAIQGGLRINSLRPPGLSPIAAHANRAVCSDHQALCIVEKVHIGEEYRWAAGHFFPAFAAVDSFQKGSA